MRVNETVTQHLQQRFPPPEIPQNVPINERDIAQQEVNRHNATLGEMSTAVVNRDEQAFSEGARTLDPEVNARQEYEQALRVANQGYAAQGNDAVLRGDTEAQRRAIEGGKETREEIVRITPEEEQSAVSEELDKGFLEIMGRDASDQQREDMLRMAAGIGFSAAAIMTLESQWKLGEDENEAQRSRFKGDFNPNEQVARSKFHEALRESIRRQAQDLDSQINWSKPQPRVDDSLQETQEYQEMRAQHGREIVDRYANSDQPTTEARIDDALEQYYASRRMVGPPPDTNGLRMRPVGPTI